jgi:hypothetical protein
MNRQSQMTVPTYACQFCNSSSVIDLGGEKLP